jgi:hypothetical protein
MLMATVLLTIGLGLGAQGAAAAMQESVRGHYTLFGQEIDINARATLQNTNASGSFRWTNPNTDPDTVVYGEVTCLIVGPARTATVGGVVTRVEPPGVGTGIQGFLISVKDNGSGSDQLVPDTSSTPAFSATPPAACTFAFPPFLSPITSGDITVQPVR